MKSKYLVSLLIMFLVFPVFAQMSVQQREFDFQVLASLYAKRYGPANWKIEALKVNVFEIKPWLDRVRAAKSDLEYFEIATEYVASFQDGHSSYRMPSNFFADSGLAVDLYEGKVLLEAWDPLRYPRAEYPFAQGDELLSLDGKPVSEWIEEFLKYRGFGNPRGARRQAVDTLTFRPQSVYPRASETPETSQAEFLNAAGERKTYTLQWTRIGVPLTQVGPVPSPFSAQKGGLQLAAPQGSSNSLYEEMMKPLEELHNWSVPAADLLAAERVLSNENGEEVRRSFVLGYGARNPYYSLPTNFQLRLGRLATDVFYSGTYMYDGQRIGFIRIGNFSPSSSAAALTQLDAEIAFFKANTDGMVVDISRNTGGGCIGLDYAQRLMPERFFFFGEQLRPTQSLLNSYSTSLRLAQLLNAPTWVVSTYQYLVSEIETALKSNRSMTSSIPACTPASSPSLTAATFENEPLRAPDGTLRAYEKPMIFLADDFSVSFGDIFPAMMQDNRRGPIVGMRTGGLGGSISSFSAGFYSEASASNTNSLVVRRDNVVSTDLPTAPYIENIGVRPDIELDYMTRANLVQRGAPFVDAFSKIMVEEIRKRR
jgi:hypothetical protein